MSPESAGRTEIGATLRDARRRYGLEVREVEERTKIRARYIRALENEDWEALPAPAYVRGFLRTYGQLLGLDGEMLADEFRRRHGEGAAPGGPGPPEPVLSESRRPGGERPPARWPWLAGILGAIVVLLLLLSLLGGDDGDGGEGRDRGDRQAREQQQRAEQRRQRRRRERRQQEQAQAQLEEETAVLTARSSVQVCLLGGDEVLIDNQVLGSGSKEKYSGSRRYRLTIGPGNVKFVVGSNDQEIEATEPTSFEGDSNGITQTDYRGSECP